MFECGLEIAAGGLRATASGVAVGPLVFVLEGEAFPEEGWRDFPVVVLGWFGQAVAGLPESGAVAVPLMDGPYELRLTSTDGSVQVEGIRRRRTGEDVVVRCGVDLAGLRVIYLDVARATLAEAELLPGASEDDTLALAAAVERVMAMP